MKIASALTLSALVALGLAGCSFSASTTVTVTNSEIAGTAGKAFQQLWETDQIPAVDCGDGTSELKDGVTLECTAVDPLDGTSYPAEVVLKNVKGADYTVSVTHGDPEVKGQIDQQGDAPTVTAADLAALAASALSGEYGYEPEVTCGNGDIPLIVEDSYECITTLDDGKDYTAIVTITTVTETNYDIAVKVDGTPAG